MTQKRASREAGSSGSSLSTKERQVLTLILDLHRQQLGGITGWTPAQGLRASGGAQHAQHKVAESFPKLLRSLYPVKLLLVHCLLRINTEIATQGQAQGAPDRHCERAITELLQEQAKLTGSGKGIYSWLCEADTERQFPCFPKENTTVNITVQETPHYQATLSHAQAKVEFKIDGQ